MNCSVLLLVFAPLLFSSNRMDSNNFQQTSNRLVLKRWSLRSSTRIPEDGSVISTVSFLEKDWYPVQTPTTVLSGLVENGVYPDPRVGMNNFRIPDVSDLFNQRHHLNRFSHLPGRKNPWKAPYWFRTKFTLPASRQGKQIWLNFKGINYRADVWLNGHKVANAEEMAGMFRRFQYNITDAVKMRGPNVLAVKIYQVDHPGICEPGTQFEVFGKGRGKATDIFKDVTLKISGGWDCAPVVRDRNMGIYQDVYLDFTDSVIVRHPRIVTQLPLPDLSQADLFVSAELFNAGKTSVSGVLKGKISFIDKVDFLTYTKEMPGEMTPVVFEKPVEIAAGGSTVVRLSPREFAQLTLKNPYLWWPNGYGRQYLHNLELCFEIDGVASDRRNVQFGIRQVTDSFQERNGEYGRVFMINGRRVFLKGGWLQPDILLNMSKKRLYDEARLLARAHVNIVANEDAPSPPDEMLEAYDKYGIMFWETFYQCWSIYPGTETADNPLDHELANKNVRDIILRYRNHPSLIAWVVACEVTVCSDLYTTLRGYVKELDPTRPFLPTTSYGWDVDELTPYMKADLPLGMTDEGPPDYTWYPYEYYFQKVLEVKRQMFRNEMGVPSIPTLSSLKKFMPDLGKEKESPIFPLDRVWAHHGAWDGDNYAFRAYDQAIRNRYGPPVDVADYVRKAQYVNANSYRAMYEAARHRMWDITSGVMLWKLNSCWPSVLWQLYDWYLNPNAAYYFTKKALEPLHLQMNANSRTVSIINATNKLQPKLHASTRVYDFHLKVKWEKQVTLDGTPDSYQELFSIPEPKDITDVYFIKLALANANGKEISSNFYWLSSRKPADLSDLNKLPRVKLEMEFQVEKRDKEYHIRITAANTSNQLAFFNRLAVLKGQNGEEVLPTFWSDNFFSLLPGEKKELTAIVAMEDMEGFQPFVIHDQDLSTSR